MSASQKDVRKNILKRIDKWADSLVDLSRKNSLISFKPPKSFSPWVTSPDIEDIFAPESKPRRVWLDPSEAEDSEEDNDFTFSDQALLPYGPKSPGDGYLVFDEQSALKTYKGVERLASAGRSDLDNKGLRTVYLAFGFLRWLEPKSRQMVLSPLVLAPVTITRESPRKPHVVTFVDDGDVVVNPALALKLEKDLGISLGSDWQWENKPLLTELAEIEKATAQIPGAEVVRKAALGRFFFHKLAIYEDLRQNREKIADHWMVRALHTGSLPKDVEGYAGNIPSEAELDEVDKPQENRSVLDADASQRRCIFGAKNGASLVIQGPPGTGKSQTIANIIAELIADGRSVLFVSEKLAALEVVHNRLSEVGLSRYLLPLHGEKAARKEIVESLNDSVSTQARGGKAMTESDQTKLASRRDKLNATARALHEPRGVLGGETIFQVNSYLAARHNALIVARLQGSSTELSEGDDANRDFNSLKDLLTDLVPSWSLRVDADYPWRGFSQVATSGVLEKRLRDELSAAASDLERLQVASQAAASAGDSATPESISDADALAGLMLACLTAPKIPEHWFGVGVLDEAEAQITVAKTALGERQLLRDAAERHFSGDIAELPDGIGATWSLLSNKVLDVIGNTPETRASFTSELPAFDRALAELPDKLRAASDAGRVLGTSLGREAGDMTSEGIADLAEFLQRLRSTSNKPLKGWLEQLLLVEAFELRTTLGALIADFEKKRQFVLEEWTEGVFDLPVEDLIARFTNQYSHPFRVVNSQFRTDEESLKNVHRPGTPPQDVTAALVKVKEALDARADFEKKREFVLNVLKEWTEGVLDLPVEDLIDRFTNRYSSPFRVVSSQFRADSKSLKNVHRSGKLPQDVTAALVKVKEVLDARADFEKKREYVLEEWTEGVFDLPVEDLIGRFTNQYSHPFRVVNSQFCADEESLKNVRRSGQLPDDVNAGLVKVKETLDARAACRELRRAEILGTYFAAEDTDLGVLDDVLLLTKLARDQITSTTDFERFKKTVCEPGSMPSDVSEALMRLERLQAEEDALVGRCRTLIRTQVKPSAERSCEAIAEELQRLQGSVTELARLEAAVRNASSFDELSLQQVTEHAALVDSLRLAEATAGRTSLKWERLFGAYFEDGQTRWDELANALAFARALPCTLTELPEVLREALMGKASQQLRQTADELVVASSRGMGSISALDRNFERPNATRSTLNVSFSTTAKLLDQLAVTIPTLREWTLGQVAATELAAQGWGPAINQLEDETVAESAVVAAIEKAFWSERREAAMKESRALRTFSGAKHSKIIAEFRTVDRELVRTGRTRVVDACNARHPGNLDLSGSETRIIKREAKKKRRFISPRNLLAQIPSVLPKLKPCLMMSPLTVSQFLTADVHFDVVIFDEASQVRTQDAINAIYRSDQVIVAGDSKQLPPSNYWEVIDDGEEADEDLEEDLESLLDETEVALGPSGGVMTLRWHYRSHHQDLIAFSNHQWYQNQLLVFASPDRKSPLLFHHVNDGVYDRGKSRTNRIEAEAVVDRLVDTVRNGDTSVGVVAFNSQQTMLIEDLLSQRQLSDTALDELLSNDRLNGVFVKNLENVQGDERDIILISLGYGKDRNGSFPMSFGPLNKDGGPRRLNVAISRARRRAEIFTSVQPEEFKLGNVSPGPTVLRNYLKFVRDGASTLGTEMNIHGGETESPFEESVLGAIEALGYQGVPQVGVASYRIDFGIVHPGFPSSFVLGIECDGASYHSSPVARDRDRLREQQLVKLGWKLHRIWSTDWIYDRAKEIEKLESAIESAVAASTLSTPLSDQPTIGKPEPAGDDGVESFKEVKLTGEIKNLPWVTTYKPAKLNLSVGTTDFREWDSWEKREIALQKLVTTEGPITRDLAIKRLSGLWGLKSRGTRVVEAGGQTIMSLVAEGLIEERDGSLSIPGESLTTVRIPRDDKPDSFRDLGAGEIPTEELDLAIRHLADGNGLSGSDLVNAVARLFGNKRTGSRIQKLVEDRIASLDL